MDWHVYLALWCGVFGAWARRETARRPYVLGRVDRAIRRVGSPRGAGCGFQAAAVRG